MAHKSIQFNGKAAVPDGEAKGVRCNYPIRLDTYGCGCQHDCSYCYAKAILDFRNLWNPKQPKVATAESIDRAISGLGKGTVVRLGGMTDCFMPFERLAKATKGAIQKLNQSEIGYLIVTKSSMVAEEEYLQVLDKKLAHIQISVTSTSDEPNFLKEKASRPSDRIRAAQTLQEQGYDVSLMISPYIPELVDIEALKASGVRKCLVEFLRVNGFIKRWLEENGYPTDAYTHKADGYRHLPLWRKIQLIEPFEGFELSVCEEVLDHYMYWKHNLNANPDDCCNLRR